jgi:2,4-diketo-3-deoxy-L-fuconate hydrolase
MKLAGYLDGNDIMIGSVAADGEVRYVAPRAAFWTELPKRSTPEPGRNVGNLSDLQQRPAVPSTSRVICIGLNYRLHAAEAKAAIPTVPVVFGRWHSTLTYGSSGSLPRTARRIRAATR